MLFRSDRRADRCPRCLEARPLAFGDRCRECEIDRLEAKAAGRVRHAPPGCTVMPAPAAEPEPPPELPPPPPVALDAYDIEDVKAMCATKRAYPSQIDADRAARRCEARRNVRLRSYACPVPGCGRWHITKSREYRAPEAA